MFRAYYQLTKPGIIYGNLLTAAAGFLLAAKWYIDFKLFLATLVGTALVIASACVYNNYIDRNVDKKMARTAKRALVSGAIPPRAALLYATVLGLIGFLLLGLYTNALVVIVGLVAFVDYVVLYGITKRRSVHGTLVGSIAGAAPITAGYVAVTDHFNGGALILFLILALWQMPHFYAIAMYRYDDYKAADIPVLPVIYGARAAKRYMFGYILAFIVAVSALTVFGYAGYSYLVVMVLIGLVWLWLALQAFRTKDDKQWARRLFFFSLIVILALSVMLSVGSILP